ncbi:MAG: hypothetical protein DLM65_09530 [Candidatus Aeolococcus gillhamiae]|uniref:HTH tetR-type domain-containing protein n=1 Tax=Candidatus Aeolococcus gillhamiae TaxID=3127015 RepID=A0A2W5Z3H3_9BACT|nr:MAG: hypothetical protein DLM65_09530 [Candidatus Dormibacter sp. RRmetagenome_bin12]
MSPADRRSQRRRLLVDAGLELMGTKGLDAMTVRAVLATARLNPRYFYESFGDVDELAVAVYDRVVEDLSAVVLEVLDGAHGDPALQARSVISSVVDFVDSDRRRGRVLYVEGLGNEALNRRRLETSKAVAAFIETYAAARQPAAVAHDEVTRVGTSILIGGFSQLLMDWLQGRVKLSRERLVRDATELFLAMGDAAAELAYRGHSPAKARSAR